MLRITFKIISMLLLSTLSAGTIFAGLAGSFDTSFGNGGKIFTSFEGQSYHYAGNKIARQADGRIVMGCGAGNNFNICLVRYNADGSLDASFGSGGKVLTDLPEGTFDFFRDMAIQPDGKIVVAGRIHYDFPFHSQGFILRYNSNGTLDPSFDGDGKRFIDSLGDSALDAVTVQSDGKIVALGGGRVDGQNGVMIIRLLSDGAFDSSFSNDGAIGTYLYNTYREAIAVQSDGKIVSSGTADNSWFIFRNNPDGSFDTSFDGDGIVLTTWGGTDGAGSNKGLVLQPDGKILAAGGMAPGDGNSIGNIAVARYNINGSLDITFDGDGRVTRHVGAANRNDKAADVVLQPDGKILVLANVNAVPVCCPNEALLGLLRLNTDGSPDMTFDGDGVSTLLVSGVGDFASSMLLQPDGKLLVAGTTQDGSSSAFYLVRFNTQAQSPFDFDGDGKTDISIYRPSVGEWWISRSSGGTFAAPFGGSNVRITPADFTGGGKTDIAFWQPSSGEWFVWRNEDDSYYSFPFGLNGDIPTVGDFDGDTKADAAIFRPSNGRWYIARSSGGTTLQVFGINGDVPVPADYDGDGKADIAIFRPSNGQWWIQRSTAGTIAYTFGNSSDKRVPGDYTGDGKADVAFWRPSTGEWFILRSENSSYYSFPFGTNGDMPSPGDYDGDGKFDAAIFRPSNARWYVNRSTAGTLIQTFGQTGDLPVPSAFVR